jgi:hypothetical protein
LAVFQRGAGWAGLITRPRRVHCRTLVQSCDDSVPEAAVAPAVDECSPVDVRVGTGRRFLVRLDLPSFTRAVCARGPEVARCRQWQ